MSHVRVYDDEGVEVELPLRWEICGTCSGAGTSSAYLGAFTSDDMADDPEFACDYMNGEYDRQCDVCHGSGKVQVVDEDRLSPELLKQYEEAVTEEMNYRAEVEMERRMGC